MRVANDCHVVKIPSWNLIQSGEFGLFTNGQPTKFDPLFGVLSEVSPFQNTSGKP